MKKYCLYCIILLTAAGCRKDYAPDAIKALNNYLVVDGFINAAPNSVSTFTLSRTRNLGDTVVSIPEIGANVTIQSRSGVSLNLYASGDGVYDSPEASISNTEAYRLAITTRDGRDYLSDYVPVKITPPIDSISWEQDRDVKLFVHTHDPANNTRYYRWDYIETYEYHSLFETSWGTLNGRIFAVDENTQTFKCWRSVPSTHISLGNTIALGNDVVSRQEVQTIVKDDDKISVRYSMLLRQFAITEEAYKYWLIIQRNSQQLGTLFDLQPSQLKGNLYSVTDDGEPVIGFIGASTAPVLRTFINNDQLTDWVPELPGANCNTQTQPYNNLNFGYYDFPDPNYAPYYFTDQGFTLVVATKTCIDCRIKGGTNQKPSFW